MKRSLDDVTKSQIDLLYELMAIACDGHLFYCKTSQQVNVSNVRTIFNQLCGLQTDLVRLLAPHLNQHSMVTMTGDVVANPLQSWYRNSLQVMDGRELLDGFLPSLLQQQRRELAFFRYVVKQLDNDRLAVAIAHVAADFQIINDKLQAIAPTIKKPE